MAGIAHISFGLAAKRAAPTVNVWFLILATEFLDLLCCALFLTGVERLGYAPWSHGLFMSGVWALAAGIFAGTLSRNKRVGLVIGLLVFSHWVLDLITHPMYFMNDPRPDLPLFFGNSPKVGLGLYKNAAIAITTEFGMVIAGFLFYVTFVIQKKKTVKSVPIDFKKE